MVEHYQRDRPDFIKLKKMMFKRGHILEDYDNQKSFNSTFYRKRQITECQKESLISSLDKKFEIFRNFTKLEITLLFLYVVDVMLKEHEKEEFFY